LFSQSNEDEVIAQIFSLIGTTNKRFVEFGSGDGRQNNTIQLLLDGWSGIWCEPHRRRYQSAKERWAKYPVEIKRRVVTPEKVNLIVKDPLDFLSIDIDGNDYAVWEALKIRPRLVCIEYVWAGLEAMTALAKAKGYWYAGLSSSKVNAFYVYGKKPDFQEKGLLELLNINFMKITARSVESPIAANITDSSNPRSGN
jgi:hypothetical protein